MKYLIIILLFLMACAGDTAGPEEEPYRPTIDCAEDTYQDTIKATCVAIRVEQGK